MFRFPSPTTYLFDPPKSIPNCHLNFVSRKQHFLYLLKLCNSIKELKQIHAQVQTSGLHSDGFLVSELLRLCALSSWGSLDYARSLLETALDPIPASWNLVIRGYTQGSHPREAVALFVEMKRRRTRPNKLTFPFLLKACSQLSDLQRGKQIQADVVKNGVDSDIYIQNTLIRFYGSCKEISDARRVFDGMCFRTVVSWNSIISGYVENSLTDECISLFAQMRGCGFMPDETTMVVLLSACAELGNLNVGKWVHSQVIVKGLVVNLQLGTALLNMYAKCGVINLALQIFGRMSERNVWTWSAMILGLAQHGLAEEALNLFQQLKNSSIEPNYVTFLGLLCACSHAGLVDEGYQFFRDMSHVHGIKPRMTHYSSMVDILGRSGRLEEAYNFITRMPVEPDAVVWRTLLSACSFHNMNGSDGIREMVKKKLLELEPRRSGNYVMVANIYAEAGLWEAVAYARRMMKDEGLKKMAGESCIEESSICTHCELMVLGFISLLLTFGQSYIAKICIPLKAADTMLPCSLKKTHVEGGRRRLLWDDFFSDSGLERRVLAGANTASKCGTGKVSLVSTSGLHQLHIFIFFLAVFHVAYSALTMTLGRLKIRRWKEWEKETQSLDYEFSNDPARFRFAHETSFVRSHSSFWNRIPVIFYIVSFFRQFFWSVRKADYLAMRHGFIVVHLSPGSKFDFQKYIKRTLEDDFKVIVGISPLLWASAVIFLLLNVHGWQSLFWVSIIPLFIVLAVGTKLQAIITKMALEIQERHAVVQGIPLVQVGDKYFWFGRPKLVLFLIHFSLFQNAFQLTYFLWIWYEFGLKSCFHRNFGLIIARVVLGVVVQFLCSYITLPLYALVSQMGSHMKKSIFDEQTSRALKKWHQAVKKKHEKSARSPTRMLGMSPGASPSSSPVHPHHLQRFKTTGHSASSTGRSHKGYYSDQDVSDMEGDTSPTSQTAVLISNANTNGAEDVARGEAHVNVHPDEDDFSFVKPSPSVGGTK